MWRFLRLNVGAGKKPNRKKTGAPDLTGKPGRRLRSMFWLFIFGPLCACGACGLLANLRGTPAAERNVEAPAIMVAAESATTAPTMAPTVEPMAVALSTATTLPSSTPTAQATTTATTLPTSTPTTPATATATALPSSTPTTPAGPAANSGANLREGPGTDYAVIGGVVAGQVLEPVGQNSAGNWLQLASGAWIAATLVDDAPPGLPVTAVTVQAAAPAPVENPTALPAAPTSGGWSREERGVIFQSECPCDQGDALNCPDFGRPLDGQACYLRCMDLVGYDVHRLDRDKDGSACEWSW